MYNLVFIITCTDEKNIVSCIESISKYNNSIKLLCLVLLQNNISLTLDKYITQHTSINTTCINEIIPLSVARNKLLSSRDIISNAYYMFPDDDSLFDNTFFESFDNIIRGNTLIAVKATQDRVSYFTKMPNQRYAKDNDYNKAISVNMVIRGSVIEQVGKFDEELGVGNYYGAGEDNDYFLRCNAIEPFTFSNDIWNYHPLQNNKLDIPIPQMIKRYKTYGRGVVYMLLKHRMYASAFYVVVRGYLGAILNLLKLDFRMSYIYMVASNSRLETFIKNI